MSADEQSTVKVDEAIRAATEDATPGLVVIFTRGQPMCVPISLGRGAIELGRTPAEGVALIEDDQVSRRHVRVALSGRGLRVTDLDSRNGTFIDGARVQDLIFTSLPRLMRVGGTLLRFTADIRPFQRWGVLELEDGVVGPALRQSREEIARTGARGGSLLITGPSGSGKESAARAFHAATERGGPFVAVNCAAIPRGLAERLLFGTRRGAYADAGADAEGYVQAAYGGTLFLDEVAELDLAVQPKLLRVLETHEVFALGDARPRKVDIRVCAATLKDLRAEVATRRFREDLYYRLGRPEVQIPPLSQRLEELPWLISAELRRLDLRLTPSALLLEACALRTWPGNVRELLLEVRQAGRVALDAGRALVGPGDLASFAGRGITPRAEPDVATAEEVVVEPVNLRRSTIEAALRRERGNVTGAARTLGMHRNQLRRWLARNSVDPASFADVRAGVDDAAPSSTTLSGGGHEPSWPPARPRT